tara:strand:+ start:745 stop:1803 length:1059 start_codon:yes stop_codon:yes gene_type:complete
MANFQKVEFEFPEDDDDEAKIVVEDSSMTEVGVEVEEVEEVEVEEVAKKTPEPKESDIEVEVVDDTPAADRNRKKSESPEEVTDDELEHYSEKVRNRIKHFSKGYHDERREKEAAQRTNTELENITRNLMADNEKLKGNMGKSQQALYAQAKRQIDGDLVAAKRDYKEAYEAGNGDKLLEAQEALTSASLRAERLKQIKIPTGQQDTVEVQTEVQAEKQKPQAAPTRAQVDPKVTTWAEKNTWFGQDKGMTAFALGYHNELVEDLGIDPASDEYYARIDARMQTVFPENFEDTAPTEKKTGRSTNVVAPATRTTSPRKVKLTKTQVQLAKRLGLSIEQYAKQVAEDMRKGND